MAFVTIICLSAIFFVALQITMLAGKDSSGNYAGGINDLLDVRVILSAVAAIQIIGTFMFTLLFFIYSKKGDADGI